jgi:hypothetical protein
MIIKEQGKKDFIKHGNREGVKRKKERKLS